jgi:hypothetical protein
MNCWLLFPHMRRLSPVGRTQSLLQQPHRESKAEAFHQEQNAQSCKPHAPPTTPRSQAIHEPVCRHKSHAKGRSWTKERCWRAHVNEKTSERHAGLQGALTNSSATYFAKKGDETLEDIEMPPFPNGGGHVTLAARVVSPSLWLFQDTLLPAQRARPARILQ